MLVPSEVVLSTALEFTTYEFPSVNTPPIEVYVQEDACNEASSQALSPEIDSHESPSQYIPLPEPDDILLAEPTLGLDPVSAKTLRNMIRNIKAIRKTILLTTHYMYEADELSDRIAIINEGKFVCLDTPERLKKNLQAKQIFRLEVSHWNDAIHQLFGVKHPVNRMNYHRKKGLIQVELELTEENLGVSDVSNFCNANNIFLHQIRIDEPTLEDVFIAKTGKRLEEADADKILA